MPRSPNEKAGKARHMYEKGLKLVEIAKKLGVPEGTVRRWKHDYDWDKKKQSERSEKEKANVRKRGAPKGNKNAVGNPGNKNAIPPDTTKHGGYSKIYWDMLDDEERELIETMPTDEETLLIQQIQLYSARERRIMNAINKYKNSEAPVAIAFTQRSETKRSFKDEEEEAEYYKRVKEKIDKKERMPGFEYNTFTQTDNKDNIIMRLEQELSTVQRAKTQAITALAKLHLDKQKLEGDGTQNDIARAWVEQVLKRRETDE